MRHRKPEQRQQRPFGQRDIATQPIAAERKLETVTGFERVLRRFGIVDRDTNLSKHAAWSEFSKVMQDSEVRRVRKTLELQQRGGLFSQICELEATLAHFTPQQLARLRLRLVSNDFRMYTPAE